MRLAQRDGSPLTLARAVVLSGSLAAGAAIGVALASLISAASSGAPGGAAGAGTVDLVVLPLIAFAAVFAVHLAVTLVLASRRAREEVAGDREQREDGQDEDVER